MFTLPNDVTHIAQTLHKNGYKAYIVGGSVRDVLLGNEVYDWDIATDALPEQVSRLFDRVIPTGIDFGTVSILLNSITYEVTTFRKDGRYVDGRRPENVSYSKNIEEDLSRRDFTVNAIAYDPITKQIIDPFNGREDLEKKIIRAVGDPLERFAEDGLRVMRACRFAAKLNFLIERDTLSAIGERLNVFKMVSIERLHDEIVKMLSSDKPSIGFEYMRETGLLAEIIPELMKCFGVEQPKEFHAYDVYNHCLYSCNNAPKDNLEVRLAGLFHDIAKPDSKVEETFYNHDILGAEMVEQILRRLKFSNENIKKVAGLVRNHMFNYTSEWTDSAVRRFINRVGRDNLKNQFLLRVADMKSMGKDPNYSYIIELHVVELKGRIDKIIEQDDALAVKDLKINGNDLIEVLEIQKGPNIGKVLNHLLDQVIETPSLNEKEVLLDLAKKFISPQ